MNHIVFSCVIKDSFFLFSHLNFVKRNPLISDILLHFLSGFFMVANLSVPRVRGEEEMLCYF